MCKANHSQEWEVKFGIAFLREKPKNHFKKVLHRKLLQILEKKDDYIDILTIQKEIAII